MEALAGWPVGLVGWYERVPVLGWRQAGSLLHLQPSAQPPASTYRPTTSAPSPPPPHPCLQLILAFTSNWTPTGGVPEYLKWAGSTNQVGARAVCESVECLSSHFGQEGAALVPRACAVRQIVGPPIRPCFLPPLSPAERDSAPPSSSPSLCPLLLPTCPCFVPLANTSTRALTLPLLPSRSTSLPAPPSRTPSRALCARCSPASTPSTGARTARTRQSWHG